MGQEYILNGQGHGNVACQLLNNGMDPGVLRPYLGTGKNANKAYITRNGVAVPVQNANTVLRKDDWLAIDTVIMKVVNERLRLVDDLRSAGLTFNIPNGMGKTVLESQRMGDITKAITSMDPARKSEADRPEFDLVHTPLPVTHKDFFFNAREIAASRSEGGSGLDVEVAAMAARKVLEEIEFNAYGLGDTFGYAGTALYGLTNFPGRETLTMTNPESGGWTGKTLLREVIQMRKKSTNNKKFGPWVLYVSSDWDAFLDEDYSDDKGDNTLRERILKISGITDIRTSDFLEGYTMILVQMTSDVLREIIGMDLTTVQWETNGGFTLNFKVLAIMNLQIRDDMAGKTGIVHGVAP